MKAELWESYIYTNKSRQKDVVSPVSQINYTLKNTRMELAIEVYKKTKLEQLKELEKSRKNYKREYNKAYNIAFEKYQQEISTLPQDSKSTISFAGSNRREIRKPVVIFRFLKFQNSIFEHNENMNVISQNFLFPRNTLIQLLEHRLFWYY